MVSGEYIYVSGEYIYVSGEYILKMSVRSTKSLETLESKNYLVAHSRRNFYSFLKSKKL